MPTVATNGVDLYYETARDADPAESTDGRPPVVFLHGAGADHRAWAEIAAPLADDYTVIALDMRLHGRSGGDPADAPAFETFVDDLAAFVDDLDLGPHAVVGLSMGGMVAQAYAGRRPDDLRAIASLGAVTTQPQSRVEWLERKLFFPVVDRLAVRFGPEVVEPLMRLRARVRGLDAKRPDVEARERIETARHEDYPEPSADVASAVREALTGYPAVDIHYRSLDVPFLCGYGEHEFDSVARHAAFVDRAVPNGLAVEIPDASHHSHVDSPDFVVDALRDFLDEHVAHERAPESA